MSNSKHTPGPWTAEFHGSVWHIEEGSGVQLSCVYVWTEDDGEKEAAANARLIAAAPELDAYRQYIEDNLERIERGGWTPVCFDEFRESEECANYMTEEEA